MTRTDPDRRPKHAAGDGAVPSLWRALDRRRLAVALGSTFVAVPVVVLDNLPRHESAKAEAAELAVEAPAASTTTTLGSPSSTTVTVRLQASAPATTEAPPPPTTTATTAAPATTTTARPRPTTTTTTAPPALHRTESGKATWYEYRDGECAHKTLPFGTVVTVTNLVNGATASCTVSDRGPYGGRRIIDLDDDTFAQLAPLSRGILDVTIAW